MTTRRLPEDLLEDLAYLVGALEDGGLYQFNYIGNRSEYRCVWTQKDLEYLRTSIVPRIRRVMEALGISTKIQIINGRTRYEVRVSSKKLYKFMKELRENRNWLLYSTINVKISFLRGLYDAEGDKSGRRLRIWNSNRALLKFSKILLEEVGFSVSTIYCDDKERGVYALEIERSSRAKFLKIISPEHPKIIKYWQA